MKASWKAILLTAISALLSASCDIAENGGLATADCEAVDISTLRSSDGQPLLLMDEAVPDIPPRPANPTALPETDPLHWWDNEWAVWNPEKANLPESPGDGPCGKSVLTLRFMDHPYLTAYTNGQRKMADAYGIRLRTMVANNDINIQRQQVEQAIIERPDLVIITPVDAVAVVPLLRQLNRAGIPVIASNLLLAPEGMPYVLAWTGPDDWGQFRELAAEFAEQMRGEGGYVVVRHMPGSSPYVSRTHSIVSELSQIAPDIELLDMRTTGLQAEETMQVVSDWLTRYGSRLKGIVSADDSGAMIGIHQALRNARREDVVVVAAGNSRIGMDFVRDGVLDAITYQSAEADGALPMKLAADWFAGRPLDRPIYYLPKQIITQANVEDYVPAQW